MQEWKLGKFFYVCVQWQRLYQDLSTSIFSGIAISTQYVSSSAVLLHTGSGTRPRHVRVGEPIKNEENESNNAFSKVAHRHDHPVASLDCVC